MTRSSSGVFLSYASEDAEPAVRLADALTAAGIEVWFDRSELRGGDAWDQEIRRQIRECALFVAIISANTDARSQGYFRLEWKLAVDHSHLIADDEPFLVPVTIDDTTEAAARVPDKFRAAQWTRLPGGAPPPAFVERIHTLLSPERKIPTSLARPAFAASTNSSSTSWRRRALAVLTVLFVAIGGYLGVHQFALSTHPGIPAVPTAGPAPHQQAQAPEKSIAVLPFVDMSEKHDQEYFSDGLAEELIGRLSKDSDLRVPARTSSFYFKGKQASIAEIARTLVVANLLEGSVRKSGHIVRVTAQLVRAADGYDVWSETYERNADDIFKIQDEIAAAVTAALQARLRAGATATPKVAISADAYNEYLLGQYQYRSDGTRASTERAILSLRKAVDLAPDYAPAWIALSRALHWSANNEWIDPHAGRDEARRTAERAISVDDTDADAHANLAALMRQSFGDIVYSEIELQKAAVLDPQNLNVLRGLAERAVDDGRYLEAIDLSKRVLTRDPLSVGTMQKLAEAYDYAGQLRESEETFRRVLALDPGPGTRALLSLVLTKQGRANDALIELQGETNPVGLLQGRYRAYSALGRTRDATSTLATFESRYGREHPYWVASMLASTGDSETALLWLERAALRHDPDLWRLAHDPDFASLRADQRIKALQERLKLSD